MTEMKIFTYGSMSEGFVHFDRIKDFVINKQAATAKGKMYRLKVGYPVYLENGQDLISGSLLTLNSNELLLNIMDEFHGFNRNDREKSLYFRNEIEVFTENSSEKTWVYSLNPTKLPKTATLIEGGDWIASLDREPALTNKLTDRQKNYICRLAGISGREIVPINDLSLYRELMNLELIVDKGRRLALSKLGHEVHRYLE